MFRDRAIRVGMAVSPRRLVAVAVRRTLRGSRPHRVCSRRLEEGPGPEGWPALAAAVADLREKLSEEGRRPLRLHLALLPSLARAKVVRLPPARRRALRRLAGRELARHFLDPPAEAVADAAPVSRPLAARGPVPCLLACAREADVRALLRALGEAGARAELVFPAEWTIVEGALALDPELRRGERRLPLHGPGGARQIRLVDAVPREIRVMPPSQEAAREVGEEGPSVRDARSEEDADEGPAGLAPPALAAFGALVAPEDGPLLLPDQRWRACRRRGWRRVGGLAAATLLLAAAGAFLHLWDLDREIRAVEERRAAISEGVSRVGASRKAAGHLRELLAALDSVRPRRPTWTRVLAEVGRRLPTSAHLETLEGTDEGVRITGRARSPSALIPGLEASALVESARLESVTRGDGRQDGQAFRIVLSLAGRTGDDGAGAPPAGRGGEPPRPPREPREGG